MRTKPLEDVAAGPFVADRWQFDRRRFLQLAGTGLLVAAGFAEVQPTIFATRRRPSLGVTPAADSPPVVSSVADLARSLEYDVERIFRFVADEIRYEPYAGGLRGANGTLIGRAGNSTDQAALLAALLDASLVPYRFVRGALDASGRQDALLAAATVDAPTAAQQAADTLLTRPMTDPSAPPPSVDPALQPLLGRVAEFAQSIDTAVVNQLQSGTQLIVSALAGAGISIPSSTTGLPIREQAQHTWLQLGSGPEWIDLDPTLPGAVVGQAQATPGTPSAQLGEDERHRVVFSVIAESISGGQLSQAVVLEQPEFADNLVGTTVSFATEKPEGLKGIGVGIAATLTGAIEYVPILMVGPTGYIAAHNITFGTGGGLFSSGSGAVGEGETTAVWLEVRIESPDATPISVRRELFDRVGPAARASGNVDVASIPVVQLVDFGPDNTNEYAPCRTVQFLAVAGGATGIASAMAPTDPGLAAADAPFGMDRLGHLYHSVRDSVAAAWGVPAGVRTFCDAPNVASLSIAFAATPDGSTQATVSIDSWHRSFGLLPISGITLAAPPAVTAGVLSHIAERVLLGEGLPADLAPSSPHLSVGRVFEEAARAGIATSVLHTTDLPADAVYPADVNARLRDVLYQGWAVIIPERMVQIDGLDRIGWWMVDPATGATVDMLDNGHGEAEEEGFLLSLWNYYKSLRWWIQLGYCVAVTAIILEIATYVGISDAGNGVKASVGMAAALGAYAFDKAACGGASPS